MRQWSNNDYFENLTAKTRGDLMKMISNKDDESLITAGY